MKKVAWDFADTLRILAEKAGVQLSSQPIVDNLRVHHSVAVREWLKGREALIELEYLPAYSPELNPDEYLNNDVKANVHRRAMPRNQEELECNVEQHLKLIARSPKRVRSYFKAKHIRYAA